MAHTITPDTGDGHLNAATVTDHALILDTLVFTASALVVADRAEYTLAEKTTRLWLKGPVVDRFRILNFTARPLTDSFRCGNSNADLVEGLCGFVAEDVACCFSAH